MQSGTAERYSTPRESAALRHRPSPSACRGLDGTLPGGRVAGHLPVGLGSWKHRRGYDRGLPSRDVLRPLPFQPTVATPSLPLPPLEAVRGGLNGDVDLMMGTNLNEGTFAVELRHRVS